jgi:hypothetical protein
MVAQIEASDRKRRDTFSDDRARDAAHEINLG